MVKHKRFISNMYIEVAPAADDELLHDLIRVSNCEVARDGMNLWLKPLAQGCLGSNLTDILS